MVEIKILKMNPKNKQNKKCNIIKFISFVDLYFRGKQIKLQGKEVEM